MSEFWLEQDHVPSNWSRIECEVLPPRRAEDTFRTRAKQLGLDQGSEDWLKFFDYAAVDSGRITDYVLKEEKFVAQLSIFRCAVCGQKFSREELQKLLELIRGVSRGRT